jgi:peptidoglycan/LPS O-acetylase OafA/YrhL
LLAALLTEKPQWVDWLRARLPHAMWLPLSIPLLMELGWDNQNALLWGLTLVELAAIVLLVAVQQRSGLVYEMLNAPVLIKLGTLSYGIYLWHYPVVRYLRADCAWPVVVVLGLLISTALSALSFYTLERWAMRYRDGRRRLVSSHRQGHLHPLGSGNSQNGFQRQPTHVGYVLKQAATKF